MPDTVWDVEPQKMETSVKELSAYWNLHQSKNYNRNGT